MCWLLPSCTVHVSRSWWYRINHCKVPGCLANRQVRESVWFVFRQASLETSLFNFRDKVICARILFHAFSRSFKPLCFVSCWFPASGSVSGRERREQSEVTTRRCKLVWSVGVLCFNVSVGRPSKVMVSSLLQRRFSRRCRWRHLSTHRIQMVSPFYSFVWLSVRYSRWVSGCLGGSFLCCSTVILKPPTTTFKAWFSHFCGNYIIL